MSKLKRLLKLGACEILLLSFITVLCIALFFILLALFDNYQQMDDTQKNINNPTYPDTPLYYKQYHGLK